MSDIAQSRSAAVVASDGYGRFARVEQGQLGYRVFRMSWELFPHDERLTMTNLLGHETKHSSVLHRQCLRSAANT